MGQRRNAFITFLEAAALELSCFVALCEAFMFDGTAPSGPERVIAVDPHHASRAPLAPERVSLSSTCMTACSVRSATCALQKHNAQRLPHAKVNSASHVRGTFSGAFRTLSLCRGQWLLFLESVLRSHELRVLVESERDQQQLVEA